MPPNGTKPSANPARKPPSIWTYGFSTQSSGAVADCDPISGELPVVSISAGGAEAPTSYATPVPSSGSSSRGCKMPKNPNVPSGYSTIYRSILAGASSPPSSSSSWKSNGRLGS
jgi:hypothetical protein